LVLSQPRIATSDTRQLRQISRSYGLSASVSEAQPTLTLIERAGAKLLAPALCEWPAELVATLGYEQGRDALLRQARNLYEEIGAPLHAERIARGLAS